MSDLYANAVLYHLQPIQGLLADPKVSEVLINGTDQIYAEVAGKLQLQKGLRFPGNDELLAACVNIAQFSGKRLDDENPRFDGYLPDGSRVHVVTPPVSPEVHVAIRKFARQSFGIRELLEAGAITEDAARFIKIAILMKRNIIVSGGTSSGKTTLLNVFSSFIPDDERIVVIEDTPELQLRKAHVVSLGARAPDHHGKGEVSIRDLLHSTLRLRPDRIMVGEVRGPEALDLLNALNSGHGGTMTTLHANSPRQALAKLETLCLFAGEEVPAMAIRGTIANAVDIVVQCNRLRDGSRKIEHIGEIEPGLDARGDYQVRPLFRLRYGGEDAYGKLIARLEGCGAVPTFFDEAKDRGYRMKRAAFGVRE